MEDWRSIIGQNVRKHRKARALTQEQLAHDVGLDLTYIGGIERGRRNPTLLVIVRIAVVLNVEVEQLLER